MWRCCLRAHVNVTCRALAWLPQRRAPPPAPPPLPPPPALAFSGAQLPRRALGACSTRAVAALRRS
jgi:hypothetical protein